MSTVRPLEAGDIDQVAALYNRTLLRRRNDPPRALAVYLREFYLDGPFRAPDIHSLVHVAGGGEISGFVGVHMVPYRIGERTVRAAFCGALMSAERDRDPLVGARLLKAFLAGPQDLSMSETAIPRSQAMWARLRGQTLATHSLDWFRILRPAGFGLSVAKRRMPLLKLFKPVAARADIWAERRRTASGLTGLLPEPSPPGIVTEEIDQAGFVALMRQFSEGFAAHPDWSGGYLEHVLTTAHDKPDYGKPVMAVVRSKGGELFGGFLYHASPGRIGRVLQIAAMPARGGMILDRLFADAYSRGAVGLRGRSQPWLIEAAPSRAMIFVSNAASVIHAKDSALAAPFVAGDCVLNGMAGESWNRFFGNRFA